MATEPHDIQQLSPDRLLLGFSKTRIVWYLFLAIVIHLLATAATSVGYVRDRWIDPEGAARRRAEQLEARKAKEARGATPATERHAPAERVPASRAPAGQAPTKPKAEPARSPGAGAAAPKTEGEIPDARKNAPAVREITDLPKKGETPKEPDGLGISIDETNK